MSIKDFHTTTTWMYLTIAFSSLYVVVISILLIIDSKSFYHSIYGPKETSPIANDSKETSNRVERVHSGSEAEVESQGTANNTDIDMSQTSRSVSSKPKRDEINTEKGTSGHK
eukprot:341636_1